MYKKINVVVPLLASSTLCYLAHGSIKMPMDAAKLLLTLPSTAEESLAQFSTAWNFAEKYSNKCFQIPKAFCFGGTSQIVTGNSVPDGLACWLTFDQLYPVDHSGNGNHMHRSPRAGPPYNGRGASAAFVKGGSSVIKSSPSIESSDFTIAFWMYLLSESNGLFRNIISKGTENSQTPSIFLYPDSRRLSVRLTTDGGSEGVPSVGILPLRRWTHVAVTASNSSLKLFINGIKDNEVLLRGKVIPNSHDLVVGSSVDNSGFEGYVDDFRFYNHGLSEAEIGSLSPPALTGMSDPEMISLGCDSCGYEFAMHSNMCGEPAAHLCSLRELYQGGIHIARINGLINSNSELWHSDITPGELAANEERMGLCCSSRMSDILAPIENS